MDSLKVSRAGHMLDTACLGTNRTRSITPGARDSPGKGLEAGIRGPCPRMGKYWDFLRAASQSQPGPHPISPLQAVSPVALWSGVVGPAAGRLAEAGLGEEHTEAQA